MAQLANALGFALVGAEAAKAAPVRNPDAIDLTMRGWALLRKPPTPKDKMVEARSLFHQALKIDPDDGDALAGSSYVSMVEYNYWRNSDTDYNAEILGQADKAISLAPNSPTANDAKTALDGLG